MKPVLDPNSIQSRITVGVVLASAIGISGFTGWLNLRMRQILVEGHKDNTLMIANRLEQDAGLFRESMVVKEALDMAIDYREQPDIAIWVTDTSGEVIAQSNTLSVGSWQANDFASELMNQVTDDGPGLGVMRLQGRHLISCVSPLEVNGELVGELYVVDEITEDSRSLAQITRMLALSSVLAIGVGAIATSLYINRAMRPIRKMNHLASNICAKNLASARLEFDRAPTEVQELAQACNMMISRLSDAWAQQRRFVSDVSHELRTPLTLVHGYLQSTLRRSCNLSAPQKEGLEIAAAEADRTIKLLQDLLDLARADSGHFHFQIERESLDDITQEVIEMCRYATGRIHSELEPVEGLVDRNRLKQVLINLIDNALKYSIDSEPITVTLREMGNRAYIDVRDTGRGIPLCDLNKIFDPFYRVDEDRSRATGGTGLGLSIVKTLVEGMNGTLKVQSKLGEGSVFTVSLPTSFVVATGDR
ncbi:HAMP domain-containing sensor histidine kinase [cf. Phormidesmis sp. LEGE 11477]|uniref:sensor histidine kinase n=1 Tax=cf. Phormidesmis sp. LEGE 11477 TaxID=1828680 RepID=UPI00188275F1|nr:HAMP domain-containing sensor histidine kinase [cf. Phormidesmis sp. LEGE 11477]MBE9062963.1 HAMP domain-containing histidine kinase [cf. Phormidesmis sp. LEGE 11477]